MDTLQAIGIAILQGATELFPISSLGHAVVLPAVLGWGLDQRAPEFLPFLVLLHTGTAVALLAYFWRDWLALGLGVVGAGGAARVRDARRLLVLIVIATIPAVVVGYGLNTLLRSLFAAPAIAAVFLAVNGIMLFAGDRLRGRAGVTGTRHKPLTAMTSLDAALIGVWQCGALLPGISRSGATIVGGLLRGLDHEGSAHFSFPHLLHASVAPGVFQQAALAAVVAGITALITTAVLMRYLRGNDQMALNPFAIYCLVAGVGSAAYLLLRHAA